MNLYAYMKFRHIRKMNYRFFISNNVSMLRSVEYIPDFVICTKMYELLYENPQKVSSTDIKLIDNTLLQLHCKRDASNMRIGYIIDGSHIYHVRWNVTPIPVKPIFSISMLRDDMTHVNTFPNIRGVSIWKLYWLSTLQHEYSQIKKCSDANTVKRINIIKYESLYLYS